MVLDAYQNVREVDTTRGRVLTDDFNPVDYYYAINREEIRRALAQGVLRM
jgi:hypothetical protein